MNHNASMEISPLHKIQISYVYLFPITFFTLVNFYLIYQGNDPDEFFLTNILICYTFILTPLLNNSCLYITKSVFKDTDKVKELASIIVGIIAFLFFTACNFYFYFKVADESLKLGSILLSLSMASLLSCLLGGFMFCLKFMKYTQLYKISFTQKVNILLIPLSFILLIAFISNFIL